MSRGKSMKLNLDLDNEEKPTQADPDVPDKRSEVEPVVNLSTKKEPNGEDIILPIRSTDEAGNLTYRMKRLDAITGDEFLSWVYDVLPVNERTIGSVVRIRDGQKIEKSVEKLKVREEIFRLVTIMHEEKWLFLRGRDRHPDYARWN